MTNLSEQTPVIWSIAESSPDHFKRRKDQDVIRPPTILRPSHKVLHPTQA